MAKVLIQNSMFEMESQFEILDRNLKFLGGV